MVSPISFRAKCIDTQTKCIFIFYYYYLISQQRFSVLSVVTPSRRVTIMAKQLLAATTPLCFGFYDGVVLMS